LLLATELRDRTTSDEYNQFVKTSSDFETCL